ncbi:hypothetical protein [Vibrio sp.]|uniref:hypothetical protein n=1 Tax=Vibrio sp. TaxID=678 RepID=UPI00311EE854
MKALETNQKKVIETKKLLKNIIESPSGFINNEIIKSALKSQGNLAKYTDEDRDITACSLNTLKNASESLLERGFSELDYLRKSALDSPENSMIDVDSKVNKSTKVGLRNMVDELETSLLKMRQSNFLLTIMISELRGDLKRMAESDDSIDDKRSSYKEINRKVEEKFNYILKIRDFENFGICTECIELLKGDR